MRLGQGFNSYNQQICLNDAVMQPSKAAQPSPSTADTPVSAQSDSVAEIPKSNKPVGEQGVSQIVSYSTRFVDKLSDVTDAMNISASLSIKTATIGGAASGSFIDSDKFKESDMNLFVQVKVVNQVISGEDYTEFQNVLPPGAKFTEIYGDTFISGFEEGGELNALISVKVSDKSKTFAVRAELEATLGTPALSGEVKGGVDLNKSKMKSSTETTVTVNWSGGGQIKPSDAIWDVNSLTLAAANFPGLVAKTPQRTYAILTKYTQLKSFLKIYKPSSVLTYENTGVYTSALLDMYMDYKSIWKQIHMANFELKNRRADIRAAKPSKEVVALARAYKAAGSSQDKVKAVVPADPNRGVATLALSSTADQGTASGTPVSQDQKPATIPNMIDYTPYTPTVMGLDKARKDCRNEMIKIVDLVTVQPDLALDPRREERFVSPRLFTQLLPIVTLRAVETDKPVSNLNPKNLVILGDTDDIPPLQQWLYNRSGAEESPSPYPAMVASLDRHKAKSKTFDMGDTWAGVEDPGKATIFFNCLDRIDDSWQPNAVEVWVKNEIVIGLKVLYTNGSDIPQGECSGEPSKKITIIEGDAVSVIQLALEIAEPPNSTARVRSLQVTLDTCTSSEFPALGRSVATHQKPTTVTLSQPTNGFWSFRGFWGSVAPYQGGFLVLGAVWGLDDPNSRKSKAALSSLDCRIFLGRSLPDDAMASVIKHQSRADLVCMSTLFGLPDVDKEETSFFNDLDLIANDASIKSIELHSESDRHSGLTGYTLTYMSGLVVRRGKKATQPAKLVAGPEGVCLSVALGIGGIQVRGHNKTFMSTVMMQFNFGKPVFFNPGDQPASDANPAGRPDAAVFGRPGPDWRWVGFWGYYHSEIEAFTHLGVIFRRYEDFW